MKYPDQLKLYFLKPKRKMSDKKSKQFKNILNNFDDILITHSHRYGAGVEYKIINIDKWTTGELILTLWRKVNDMIPDNLKKV